MRIFPSITTTDGVDWRRQIQELKELGLKEVCLFPTCLELKQRKELYKLLETAGVENIPFVHLRSDMDIGEIEFFIKRYKTKVFNIHSRKKHQLDYDLSKFRSIIYLENHELPTPEPEIKQWAGICLDATHAERERLMRNKHFPNFLQLLEKYPCGCCHLSAIKPKLMIDPKTGEKSYEGHTFADLNEFDYVQCYQKFLPDIIALELENPISEQLKAKEYLEKLLKV